MATGAAAHADTTMISQDNTGILNGTQVYAPIQAPVNLCGVAAAVGGQALAKCDGGSSATIKDHHDVRLFSRHNVGLLNGTQVHTPIQAPINVCGVAAGVIGAAAAGCDGGASAKLDGHHHYKGKHHKPESAPAAHVLSTLPRTLPAFTDDPLLSGLPVVGLLLTSLRDPSSSSVDIGELDRYTESGRVESDSEGGQGGGKPTTPGCGTKCPTQPPAKPQPPKQHGKHHHPDVTMITGDNIGILNGTQVYAPIQIPVDASGIAVSVLGQSHAHSDGGSSARM